MFRACILAIRMGASWCMLRLLRDSQLSGRAVQ